MLEKYDFVVDAMLGKLARWLRVMGYSVYYDPKLEDKDLLQVADRQATILVTRDRLLAYRANKLGIKAILVGEDLEDQLKALADKCGLSIGINLNRTRCPKCNARLKETCREHVKDKVPQEILRLYEKFYLCLRCGSVYWLGSHYLNMQKKLHKLSFNNK